MRILHFCPQFSPLSETFVYGYVTELERQGSDGHVVTIERMNEVERPFPKVHVVSWPARWHVGRWWHHAVARFSRRDLDIYAWPIVRRRLSALVKRVRPDVIHAHFGTAGFMISPAAAAHRIPLVVTFYGHDISSVPREPLWQGRYRDLWGQVAAVTVLSQNMQGRAVLLGCPRDKIHVVHLARAIPPVPLPAREVPLRSFISVGRLVEKKGQADTIRAFARMARRDRGMRLDIVGEGPLEASLVDLARTEEIADQVRIHGALPNPAVMDMMRAAGAFVLCSKTAGDGDEEGTPTVLVEAQLLGLPCVSTHHAGISEVIAPENHDLLAPEGDVAEIARRMEQLTSESAARVSLRSEHGRRHVAAHFDLSIESGKLAALYSQLARPKVEVATCLPK